MTVNELIELIEKNEIKRFEQSLIKNLEKINKEDKEGVSTLLSTAVDNNNLSAVKLLIDHKADLEKTYPADDDTVLISATYANYYEIAKVLIENGANVNYKNDLGKDALYYASLKRYFKIRDFLLEHGADKTNFIDTSLIDASSKGDLKRVKQLLREHIDVNLQDYEGKSALMEACLNSHLKIAQKLIDNGADINLKDYDYDAPFLEIGAYELFKTTLMRCIDVGNIKAISFLIDNDANIDIQTYQGETALMMAAKNANEEIVKKLLDQKADVNLRNFGVEDIAGYLQGGEKNALFYAITEGNVATVKLLEIAGSSKNLIEKNTYSKTTPLMFACEYGNLEVVKHLLTLDFFNNGLGSNIVECDKKGKTALIHASLNGHKEIVELLIEDYKENIDTKDCEGKTALMHACHNYHFDTATLLLENEADETIEDNDGYSVLDRKDKDIKYFFEQRKKNNPQLLIQILTNFTLDEPIKYTTHEWRNRIDHKYPQYREDFSLFLNDVTAQVTEHEKELGMLSTNLYKKIYDFIVNDQSGIGWSSLEGLKTYMGGDKNNEPFNFELPQSSDAHMLRFKDRIEMFKNEIEIRGNMLQDIFIGHKKTLGRKYKINISSNLENVKFYTDVEYFQKAIDEIFEEIKKYAEQNENFKVYIDLKTPVKEYVELHITHKDSYSERNAEELLERIENEKGDSVIGGYLKNLCDWYIVAKHKEDDFKIDCFGGTSEPVEDAEGFTHIMRFYK